MAALTGPVGYISSALLGKEYIIKDFARAK
jgi:hypothetical protein